MAWADPATVAAYLTKAPATFSAAMRDYLLRALVVIRQRGYVITANGPALRALRLTSTLPLHQQRDEAYWLSDRVTAFEIEEGLDFETPASLPTAQRRRASAA